MILLFILVVFVVTTTVQTCYKLVVCFQTPPNMIFKSDQYFDFLSSFFFVLIGLELIHSVVLHLEENSDHIEIMVEVSITAIMRKIIILDFKTLTFGKLGSMAAVVAGLGFVYFCLRASYAKSFRSFERVEQV